MCHNPITITNKYRNTKSDTHLITVPCGKCVRCISKKRQEWAFRMYQESKDHATAYYLTLTYNEEELPYLNLTTGEYPVRFKDDIKTLSEEDQIEKIVYKKDLQDFIKKVRRSTNYTFTKDKNNKLKKDLKIRYYFTSEYGTKFTKRPHYHGIIWNLQPNIAKQIENQKIWTKGNVKIDTLDSSDVATYYYLTKYLYKQKNYNIWTFKPFQLQSQGIGRRYIETHENYHIAKGDLITKFNKSEIIIPRYYRDKLPNYLKKASNKKTEKYIKEKYQKDLIKTRKQKHTLHQIEQFKKLKKDEQNRIENLIFKSKFNYEYL